MRYSIIKAKNLLWLLVWTMTCCQSGKDQVYKNYIGSWSPDGKQILFYSDRNENWDIFLVQEDGSQLEQITSSQANETEPNWHPHKNEFAFATDITGERKINIHNFETKETRVITHTRGKHASPAWSPDGTHLAYLSQDREQWNVWVIRLSDLTHFLVYNGNIYPGRPTWSPPGKEVMYSIAVNGTETLHLAATDGKIIKKIIPGFNSCGNAAISPDGSKIVFDAHRDDVLDSGDGKWEIYTMSVSGDSAVRLTNNDRDDWGARWSPDGSRLLYMGGGFNNTGYELFVMNSDGSGQVQLTDRN